MAFPGQDNNPWQVAEAVRTAGFAQDVVIATSHLLHGIQPTERDWKVLEECRDVLQRLSSGTVTSGSPMGDRHLGPADDDALLRVARAVRPGQVADFERAAEVLDVLLRERERAGAPSTEALTVVQVLRDIFLAVGEANLRSMTATTPKLRDAGTCKPLITSSAF